MTSTDRISQLPDSVLHHIMSFMKAKAAVRTCVLSKRWRHLWASLKHLHFDFTEFRNRETLYWEEHVDRYYKFISRMLQERENIDVHTFDMDDFYELRDDDNARAREWIGYAVDHNARVIHFTVHRWSNLPPSIYTCTSLEELEVYTDSSVPIILPESVNLPRLKSLDLCCVNHQFLKLVLPQCPALEDLSLTFCSSIDLRGIPFYKLRNLCVSDCTVFCGAEKFSVPSLESFSFEGSMSTLRKMGIESMPSLTYAYFYAHEHEDGDIDASPNNGNCNILRALSNARKLEFYASKTTLRDLKEELQNCPTFFNLAELFIHGCVSCHSNMIARMLESSPYLQKLTISHADSLCHEVHNCERTTIKSAVFKSKYLETIEIEVPSTNSRAKPLIEDLIESIGGGNELFKIKLIVRKDARAPTEDFETLWSSLAQENPQIILSYKLFT